MGNESVFLFAGLYFFQKVGGVHEDQDSKPEDVGEGIAGEDVGVQEAVAYEGIGRADHKEDEDDPDDIRSQGNEDGDPEGSLENRGQFGDIGFDVEVQVGEY